MDRTLHKILTRRTYIVAGLLFVATSFSVLAMQGLFSFVKAVPQGDEIAIQWQTSNEYGVQSFEIERKSDESPEYRRLTRVEPRGAGFMYTYIDDGAFYKSASSKQFTYRIRAVGPSTQQYSPSISIAHEVSSVRKSWGMIKELFR
jgi:hypothetical protein